MSPLAGKYVLEKQENFEDYLRELGTPEEHIKSSAGSTNSLEIRVEGNDYILNGALGNRKFPLGKEIDEPLGPQVLKSTATLDGNKLVIKSKDANGKVSERTYESTATGVTVTISSEGIKTVGKLFLKRA